VLDDDEGHAAPGGHVPEELLERFQTSRRCADADDREVRTVARRRFEIRQVAVGLGGDDRSSTSLRAIDLGVFVPAG
jgi:hypothetical protein